MNPDRNFERFNEFINGPAAIHYGRGSTMPVSAKEVGSLPKLQVTRLKPVESDSRTPEEELARQILDEITPRVPPRRKPLSMDEITRDPDGHSWLELK